MPETVTLVPPFAVMVQFEAVRLTNGQRKSPAFRVEPTATVAVDPPAVTPDRDGTANNG